MAAAPPVELDVAVGDALDIAAAVGAGAGRTAYMCSPCSSPTGPTYSRSKAVLADVDAPPELGVGEAAGRGRCRCWEGGAVEEVMWR